MRSVRRPAIGAATMIITVEGRKRDAGLERRVAQDVLHVERQKKNIASIAKDTTNAIAFAPKNERAAKNSNSTIGARTCVSITTKATRPRRMPRTAPMMRGEPQPQLVALDERQHERAEADRDRARRRR